MAAYDTGARAAGDELLLLAFDPRRAMRERAADQARGMIAEAGVILAAIEGPAALCNLFLNVFEVARKNRAGQTGEAQ